MLFLAIISILFAGFASAGMSFVGFHSFYRSRKWQHCAGGVLYAVAAFLLIGWVFSMTM